MTTDELITWCVDFAAETTKQADYFESYTQKYVVRDDEGAENLQDVARMRRDAAAALATADILRSYKVLEAHKEPVMGAVIESTFKGLPGVKRAALFYADK